MSFWQSSVMNSAVIKTPRLCANPRFRGAEHQGDAEIQSDGRKSCLVRHFDMTAAPTNRKMRLARGNWEFFVEHSCLPALNMLFSGFQVKGVIRFQVFQAVQTLNMEVYFTFFNWYTDVIYELMQFFVHIGKHCFFNKLMYSSARCNISCCVVLTEPR